MIKIMGNTWDKDVIDILKVHLTDHKNVIPHESNTMLGDVCQECGGTTKNEGSACKGACSQEIYNGVDLMNTTGLLSCNCCEACRWKCHNSFMQSIDDGEQ